MAESPAHKFGQIIGDAVQAAIEPLLQTFAAKHRLYLDKHGPRPGRQGSKVTWSDRYGNTHDLDFVLERGGSSQTTGAPVAFIEVAWRRYTKHSRNKAQEIQGAILPLQQTYDRAAPFIGVIMAGVFTDGAITQLRSLGFTTLYMRYDTVVAAFRTVGINAQFDEQTPDAEVMQKVRAWERLKPQKQAQVSASLLKLNDAEVRQFMEKLSGAVSRRISSIRILPLHGTAVEWNSVDEAISFIQKYERDSAGIPVNKIEVQIRYNNDDRIEGTFAGKQEAIEFLRTFQGRP